MPDVGDYLPERYCTVLDVRNQIALVLNHHRHSDNKINNAIVLESANVKGYLAEYYTEAMLQTTPWLMMTEPPAVEENEIQNKTLRGKLLAAGVSSSTGRTEYWKIQFTSTTAFSVESELYGTHAAGATSANYTSSDSRLTIDKTFWQGTFAKLDSFYICTYKHYADIVLITSLLAGAHVISPLYAGQDSGEEGKQSYFMRKRAMEMIKALQNPDGLNKGDSKRLPSLGDVTYTPGIWPYDMTVLGQDATKLGLSDTSEYGELYGYYGRLVREFE